MKKIVAVLVLAAIGLSSCKKEEAVKPSPVTGTLEMTGKTEVGQMD